MNYTAIIEELGKASLFDLYRLSAAIHNQLEDPARIAAVKRNLRVGQTLRWFDSSENRLHEAKLLRLNRTRAEVQNLADGKYWNVLYATIDLEGRDVAINPHQPRKMDRNSVKVGDNVAFRDRHGQERFGRVLKLNPKTASVQVGTIRWRVGYGLLVPVIDGQAVAATYHLALPGEWVEISAEKDD